MIEGMFSFHGVEHWKVHQRGFWLTIQLSKISSTTHSSLPSTISGKGGRDVHWPGMGSGGAKDILTTLKNG